MGARSIKLPDVGEGIAEAEIVEWLVKIGDFVKEDQVVSAVMTDKATVEIPTPVSGTVLALGAEVGSTLAIGAELIRLDVTDGSGSSAEEKPLAVEAPKAPKAVVQDTPPKPAAPQTVQAVAEPKASQLNSTPAHVTLARPLPQKALASPSVRQKAKDAGIDLQSVHGTGPAGRVLHEDIEAYASQPAPTGRSARAPDTSVKEIRVIGMRRRIAQNMAKSCRRIAHFSYVEEIDVTSLEDLRASLNKSAKPGRPKLTLLPFLMLAINRAVVDFPQMNALYDDEAEVIKQFAGVHIGIATQTPVGLMVPVVRHVEAKSIYECASEVARLSQLARDGQAGRDDLTGSTITITSLGAMGGLASTPVINRPEVAIIGVNKMSIKPVWQNGAFIPRKMMNLSSSFDHRVIDGFDAAVFVQRLRALLETPALIFMES